MFREMFPVAEPQGLSRVPPKGAFFNSVVKFLSVVCNVERNLGVNWIF